MILYDNSILIYSIQICLKKDQLACLRKIKINEDLCQDKCEGINADIVRSTREPESKGKLNEVFEQYENYKCPNISDIKFPFELSMELFSNICMRNKMQIFFSIYRFDSEQI